MSLKEKVFLITGASSGIGLAIARGLAREGAKVAAMARSEAKLIELAATAPGSILAVPGDVIKEADCRAAIDTTSGHFGRLDGLIHSAGISMRGLVAETKIDVFREVMEINYFALLRLIQATVVPIKANKGHIAVISSIAGHVSYPRGSGYAASKHAVQALMDALRLELHSSGVHVLSVCPGFVKTDISLNARNADGSAWAKMDKDIEDGLDPDEVARKTITALKSRKAEIYPAGLIETAGLYTKKFVPALVNQIMLNRYQMR